MLNKLQGLQVLLRTLIGCEGHLAGGCVRDTLMGVTPKDYDFVITEFSEDSDAFIFSLMTHISGAISSMGLGRSEVYQAYESCQPPEFDVNPGSFTEMFNGCMKVTLKGNDEPIHVDILFSKYPTIEEHIKQHDCNANMVYLNDAGEIVGSKVDELIFRAGICPERIRYMTEKWSNIRAGI